ncbi:Rqc2 family fibronectin-binding protein [Peptostreptococcus equinus]|uniref:Rqc2 homolog RqcH n=1 Tax=Peptostreptococcus equinus TaxID=3003601 RepID=A0ABY7JRC8_9FIRM|nr:NFACT RNA binding domain-containing protein [Peptostreptococcus sp. CBA3647]WAW14242.1 NFACT RNA binding domain-containing protein [Peptostreptococcus sp. CBA3647]
MSLDAIVVSNLANELNDKLVASKIDKVYQPEKDEICLKIRAGKDNYKFVISASASNPRLYISDQYDKNNPKKAPVFCMTLRKHIQSGVIDHIEQIGFERIIKIAVDSYDELKEKTRKFLYIEIMGKHSNIILVSEKTGKIIDSIKRVPISVSRLRQVLPGNDYELPPVQDKINPKEKIEGELFREMIVSFDGPIYKAIYMTVLGLSPLIAREICYRIGIDQNIDSSDLTDQNIKAILKEIRLIFANIELGKIYPNMIVDKKIDKIVEFSTIKLNQYEDLNEVKYPDVSSLLENYYFEKDSKERMKQKSSSVKKTIQLKLERLTNKIEKQKKELKEAKSADKYKLKGELLTAYIYLIKKGMENIEVENFYDNNKKVSIELNKNLSPSENAQKYYKKYNKLKNAREEITNMMKDNLEEKDYLENIILSIENCQNEKELKEIKEELMREGYIKAWKMPKKNNKPTTSYMKFMSSKGKLILVGKNNKQNDYLTLRLADNEDLWFHTKDIPGSHVLIKCAGKTVDDSEIIQAATLAAYYSKARMSSNVPVDYTFKKYVKKPSGAKPGMVIYETNKTVYITPSDEEKAKIKIFED